MGALREIVVELARLPDANRHLAGLMSGLDLRYDLGDPDPLVGSRMVDLALHTAAGPRTVGELLRPGRGLLLELGGHRPGRAAPAAADPGTDRVPARVVDSPVGTALGAARPVDRVLVRPDGHVGWIGAAGDPAPPVAACCAAPTPASTRSFSPAR